MSLILQIHSLTRWIVVVVAAVALVRYGVGWWKAQAFSPQDALLMTATSWLLIVQLVLGVILLIWNYQSYQLGHLFPMLIAVGLPHMAAARGRKAANDQGRHRVYFLFLLGTVVLVVVGVFALPGGWSRNVWLN
jgi:hypothetical protein